MKRPSKVSPASRRLAAGVALAAFTVAACVPGPGGYVPPYPHPMPRVATERLLIKHGWDAPRAQFVHDHVEAMERQGFDGVAISLGSFWNKVHSQVPISETELMAELAPLDRTSFRSMTHNFVVTYSADAGSYFADYTVPLENFRALARTGRQLGLEGIMIDTEDYNGTVQNWPEAAPGHTLREAQDQAARRGGEIVRAVAEEWPDVTMIVFGGPWVSEPATGEAFKDKIAWNDASFANELRGPFFVGMVEAAVGSSATVVDGGDVYTLRTQEQFDHAYWWMKDGLAEQSPLVPDALRSQWAATVSVAFGVYDLPWLGQPMDAAHWETALGAALCRSDRWVWAYTEQHDWWGGGWPDPSVPDEWVSATARARAAARACADG